MELSVAARLALRDPSTVCDDDDWIDVHEVERFARHRDLAWQRSADGTWLNVCDGPKGRVTVTPVAHPPAGDDDLVVGNDGRVGPCFCYTLGPVAARALLAHGLPMEQRVDGLIRTLAANGTLRVRLPDNAPPVAPPSAANVKRRLPNASIGGTAVAATLLVVLACVCLLPVSWRASASAPAPRTGSRTGR